MYVFSLLYNIDSNQNENSVRVPGVALVSMLSEMVEAFFGLSVGMLDETPVDIKKRSITARVMKIEMRYNQWSNTTQLLTSSIFPILQENKSETFTTARQQRAKLKDKREKNTRSQTKTMSKPITKNSTNAKQTANNDQSKTEKKEKKEKKDAIDVNDANERKGDEKKEMADKKEDMNLYCLMGICIMDLFPKDDWNFVYGEAKPGFGVGVFSFARYMPDFDNIAFVSKKGKVKRNKDYKGNKIDKNKLKLCEKLINNKLSKKEIENLDITTMLSKENQKLFFRRSVNVLVHEIGHLFGMNHCVYFECVMNGRNHLKEHDSGPVYLCPICLHKLYFCILGFKKMDILGRYQNLCRLYQKYQLNQEYKWYQNRIDFIKNEISNTINHGVSSS